MGDVGWAVGQRLEQPSGGSVVGADTDLGRRQEVHGHALWRRAGHLRGETSVKTHISPRSGTLRLPMSSFSKSLS